ncbi:MAG TPA: nitroreductase/quinone reductase family protein [Candidatus Acidoferrales bacterium]|nr:nitroreductase/quinone reductase family protein [Candidatus Acidoferrales bacterium]
MPARSSAALVRLSMRLNPLVAAILRSPLHWLLSPGLMLITVTGRKSGRRYTIPVGYHQAADAVIVMVGEAPSKTWWRNYRDPGPIELRLRGKLLRGRAQVLPPDSAEFRNRADASLPPRAPDSVDLRRRLRPADRPHRCATPAAWPACGHCEGHDRELISVGK